RPAVQHLDAEPHQPRSESGVRLIAPVPPRRTIVCENCERQSVMPEYRHQLHPNSGVSLVAAGPDRQRIAGMIVDHGQRMAAAAGYREVALEIHLPQLVGFGALEPLIRPGMLVAPLLEATVTPQDLGDCAQRRHVARAALHHPGDLARTPGI